MTTTLQAFAAGRASLGVQVSSPGLFPGPSSVLFAAPVVSPEQGGGPV